MRAGCLTRIRPGLEGDSGAPRGKDWDSIRALLSQRLVVLRACWSRWSQVREEGDVLDADVTLYGAVHDHGKTVALAA